MKIKMEMNIAKKWYFNLVSSNGRILMTSESYSSRWQAERMALRLGNKFKVIVYNLRKEAQKPRRKPANTKGK